MAQQTNHIDISTLCRTRLQLHRQEVRDKAKEMLEAIERSVAPLSDVDAERPFMIPRGHNPYDIWYYILEKVSDPQSILALWDVCPLFREMLRNGNKYVQAGLPHIVKFILKMRPQFMLQQHQDPDFEIYSTSKKIRLNLRLISKVCKTSMEGLHQADDVTSDRESRKFYLELNSFEKIQRIVDDVIRLEVSIASIFPRNVEVNERVFSYPNFDKHRHKKFLEAVGNLLKLIGKRILVFRYRSLEGCHYYANLVEWVSYMPNMEKLETNHGDAYPRLGSSENIPSFPLCPKLRAFIQVFGKLPEVIILRIIATNPQITFYTQSWHERDGDCTDPAEMNLRLEQLERLDTPAYTPLLRFQGYRFPLKGIVVPHRLGAEYASMPCFQLFAFLSQFGESLERLELNIGLTQTEGCFLNLPKLKIFKWIRYKTTFGNLLFLLHASRLEEIHLSMSQIDNRIEIFSDEFFQEVTNGFEGRRIWEVFPRMKNFVIKSYWFGGQRRVCRS